VAVVSNQRESVPHVVENALWRYSDGLETALRLSDERSKVAAGTGASFAPRFALPPRDSRLEEFFAVSGLGLAPMGAYGGKDLWLLDLMGNPRTRTTKTFGSLVIVARAIRHIRETGEPVMIITPSAANKATALRDAVLRAYETGLAGPAELNVAVVVPTAARSKVWRSPLVDDPALRERNPVLMYPGVERETVKPLTRAFIAEHAEPIWEQYGVRVWDSLHVDNYKVADVVRAYFEREVMPASSGGKRLHVHAVSSAYGFLGHNLGERLLGDEHGGAPDARYLVVQHLFTPDVVLALHFGRISEGDLPRYEYDAADGLLHQRENPYFPYATLDVSERLEPTFYTRSPPTLDDIKSLMATAGGTGMVVSLHECLARYGEVRALLERAGMGRLPADPRQLREWALVMAAVGAMNAIDRDLVEEDEVVIHGSGCYSENEFDTLAPEVTELAEEPEDVARAVYRALAAAPS
jgi:Family of unknown function (DUF6002)